MEKLRLDAIEVEPLSETAPVPEVKVEAPEIVVLPVMFVLPALSMVKRFAPLD